MRISIRDPNGTEIDHTTIDDPADAVYEAMRMLSRRPSLAIGSLITLDDDNAPNVDQEPTIITANNLVALAGRLEALAKMMADSQPGNAADLRVAALLARHVVKVGWVFTSVSLVA